MAGEDVIAQAKRRVEDLRAHGAQGPSSGAQPRLRGARGPLPWIVRVALGDPQTWPGATGGLASRWAASRAGRAMEHTLGRPLRFHEADQYARIDHGLDEAERRYR